MHKMLNLLFIKLHLFFYMEEGDTAGGNTLSSHHSGIGFASLHQNDVEN